MKKLTETSPTYDDSTIQIRLYLRTKGHMIMKKHSVTSPASDDSTMQIRLYLRTKDHMIMKKLSETSRTSKLKNNLQNALIPEAEPTQKKTILFFLPTWQFQESSFSFSKEIPCANTTRYAHDNFSLSTSKPADQRFCADIRMMWKKIRPPHWRKTKWVLHLLFWQCFTGHALTWWWIHPGLVLVQFKCSYSVQQHETCQYDSTYCR